MKRKAILDEQHLKQLDYLIGEMPLKYALPILQLIESVVKTEKDDNNSNTDSSHS